MQISLMVLVLGVLIPVSGFIAWAGDRIGHQVGKKRHTLLGLRPRHTAMLFTIGSGIGISIVSFLLLWVSSEGFRLILSEGVQLLSVNKSLRTENRSLADEVKNRANQTEMARNDARVALQERDAARKVRDDVFRQSAIAHQELSSAQKELMMARDGLRKAQAAYEVTKTGLDRTTRRLETASTDLQAAQQRIVAAQERVRSAELAKTHAELDARSARVAAQKAEANRIQIEATAGRTVTEVGKLLKEQTAKADEQRIAFEAAVNTKQEELKRLQVEVDSLQSRREELAQQLGASLSSTTALRRGQITFRVGEEVARVSISSDQSIWRIESALDRFWVDAAKKAEERGAAANPIINTRAVALAPRIAPSSPNGSGTAINSSLPSEQEALYQLAQTIRRSDEPVAVVLIASTNAIVGEPVVVDVKTYRNPVIIKADTKLAETTIMGNSETPRETAADQMYEFLRRDVRRSLLDAGLIPTVSGDTEEGDNVVTLTGGEWLKIMDDLKRANFRAKVLVKTAKAIRAADRVTLIFDVKSLPAPPVPFDFSQAGSVNPKDTVRP